MPGFPRIFINPHAVSSLKQEPAYKQQALYLKRIWDDDTYGLERIFRLLLCLIQFTYPVLLIRHIFGRWGATSRKLAVESYTVLKLILPMLILWGGFYRYPWLIGIIIFLLTETTAHILNLIFLSDVHSAAVSYHRSILLLLLHYLEVVLDFACIYIGFDLLNEKLSWVSAVYFSIVANTTVGFGDIHAVSTAGRLVVITQLLIGVLFIILFINYFSQKINDEEQE
jgi:hypothetical protein